MFNSGIDRTLTVRLNALHAQHARERVKTNGKLHEVLQPEKPSPRWWEKYFKLENLTVAGREVKGLVVPHWAAGVLLAALISIGWTTYSKVAEQRDMLIEMKTELKLAKEHELEYRNEFKTKLNVQQLQIEQLNLMKAVLLPQNGKQTQRKEN